jgi:hypothetical protein
MSLIVPSWFKHRQGKAEEAAPNVYRLTAPLMPESFVTIRQADNGKWSAALRRTADGPDVAATDPVFETPGDAWSAAFELVRFHLIY